MKEEGQMKKAKGFWRRLVRRFFPRHKREREPVAFLCESPPWEPSDRMHWRRFLNTAAGQKLQAKIQHGEYRISIAAVEADADEAVHACGRASGYRGLAAYLFSLSAPDEPQSSDTAHPDEGDQDPRAHYSP